MFSTHSIACALLSTTLLACGSTQPESTSDSEIKLGKSSHHSQGTHGQAHEQESAQESLHASDAGVPSEPEESVHQAKHGAHGHGHGVAADEHGHGAAAHGAHAHKAPLGHRFEKADEWVARFEGPKRDRWQKPAEVIRFMNISPGMRIADVGAGTGYLLPYLSKAAGAAGEVLGIDIEPDMVRYMNERAKRESLTNSKGVLATPEDPGMKAQSVDRVIIVDTWHHIPDREAYSALLKKSLKPGGKVFIVDFTMTSPRGPKKSHRLRPEQAIKELKAGGLEATLIKESLPYQWVVEANASEDTQP